MTRLALCLVAVGFAAQDVRVAPVLAHYVQPVYTDAAKAAGAKGIVVIEATIDTSGEVVEAHVLRSVPFLDQAVIDAVKQWRYKPATLNGTPVRTTAVVSVPFPAAAPFDLTGTWTVVSSKLGEGTLRLDGPFGQGFTAVQTSDELTVDAPSPTTGRGGVSGRPIHITYRLDGSVTNIAKTGAMNINANTGQVMSGNTVSTSWTTASWVGERLQIQQHDQTGGPDHVASQMELWLNADGTLEAERTLNPSGGNSGSPTLAWRATYRKLEK